MIVLGAFPAATGASMKMTGFILNPAPGVPCLIPEIIHQFLPAVLKDEWIVVRNHVDNDASGPIYEDFCVLEADVKRSHIFSFDWIWNVESAEGSSHRFLLPEKPKTVMFLDVVITDSPQGPPGIPGPELLKLPFPGIPRVERFAFGFERIGSVQRTGQR